MGADDKKADQEGMTPSNLARQESMLQDLRTISILVAEGKTKNLLPDLEMMKRAVIVDDGS